MARQNLKKSLCRYIKDTLSHIDTVRGFRERLSPWMKTRKTELTKINDKISQEDLAAVVKDTLGGLKELDRFLDAVEKLAVTSLHVFMEENQALHLPRGISLERVQAIIIEAWLICPLLLEFKRDASVFFLPKLQNVKVLSYQLDKYIQTTQKICDMLEKSSNVDFCQKMNKETLVELDGNLSEDEIQRMLRHLNQLDEIRMNQNFRTVFLFQEVSCSGFINEFNKRHPRMLQFLHELEECAVHLDRMNKGAKISSVAGSSVGAAGGVLSIIGLALIPFTGGASLGLVMGGTALGITSGVNSVVTKFTEVGVNSTQQKKANEVLHSFMEDVQSLHDCLEKVTRQPPAKIQAKVEHMKILMASKTVVSVGWSVRSLAKDASAAKALKSGELVTNAVEMVAQGEEALLNVASDTTEIAQSGVEGTLALSKTARAGAMGLNALFVGLDVFFIVKDGISLSKGSETEVSQFLRARAALWSSEMDSWQKICESLRKGLLTSEKNKAALETPFYPEREMKKQGNIHPSIFNTAYP